ncbi:MAG: RNA 2',3'-cyclic phosphodiesterase [Candidatus Omnitrophica bacterium]|nr:RNA 2',3'-cyclic phosphodiesterase [Candidatus Omnitrophota bacterium]
MRAFIAIDLSDDNKAELSRLRDELKQAQADVKWVQPENIHLTLKFLGEVTDEYVGKVQEALDRIAAGFKPFEVSLLGIGAFPKLDYPRVIWVGLDKGKEEAEEIAKNIEEELEKLGFAKEDRPFAAHLTIGRVRSGKNKEALKDKIETVSCKLLTVSPQLVSSIVLYQSTLTPHGPIYTALHAAPFNRS